MTEKESPEGAAIQSQIDSIKVRRVARALGIQLGKIPDILIPSLREKILDLDQSFKAIQLSEDSDLEGPPLTGTVLTPEFARSVNAYLQELPTNTILKDLRQWRDHPYQFPVWTSLMLRLTASEAQNLGNILGHILRSTDSQITLADLVSNFNVDQISGLGNQRKAFFMLAFQGAPEETEEVSIDPDQLREQLIDQGIIRLPKTPRERIPRVAREPRSRATREKSSSTLYRRAGRIDDVEQELWEYAVNNNLVGIIVSSKSISPEELEQLSNYFESKGRRGSLSNSLLDRFSVAVARLV